MKKMKMQGKDQVALTIFGEGAVNQGVFFETLNLSVIWKLPVIFLCENNLYSEMTPSYETTSNVATSQRGASFGMPAVVVDGNDVEPVFLEIEKAVTRARSGGGPTYIEAMTYRLWGHMMGDVICFTAVSPVCVFLSLADNIGRLRRTN